MPTCVLHVGMPKTGTSAIQESLFYGLEDPGFRLISLGHPNGVQFLEPLFGEAPDQFWVYRRNGLSPEGLRQVVRGCDRRLRAALRRTRAAGATAVVSAERCWSFSAASLERLRDYLAEEGFDVRVIAYLRPHGPWLESTFQQAVKGLHAVFDLDRLADDVRARPEFWYPERLAGLERVFGRDHLAIRLYDRATLSGGCAVRDFCTVVGIHLDDARVIRANESISADAVRMLYCFHRYHPAARRLSLWANHLLVRRLERLGGPPFRFHASLVEPLAAEIAVQEREIFDRYGVNLRRSVQGTDHQDGVRCSADMWQFSQASLDWLAGVSGRPPINGGRGEATARQVADQVAAIADRPSLGLRLEFLGQRLRRSLRQVRHGD